MARKITAPTEQQARPTAQVDVVALLNAPTTYGENVDKVELIETHGALVFLAGSRAYKLKRAVKLPYMDFSTLEKRRAACNHELERNKAAAPEMYVGVVPVVRTAGGGLALGGEGEPVDWVVVMERFEQTALFDNLAVRGALEMAHMPALAETIAEYHKDARTFRGIDGSTAMAATITQIVTALFDAGDVLDLSKVQRYANRLVTELNATSRLLRARSQRGALRLCHGDLHLRNIVLSNGRPMLFDAIEFDDGLATVDVLNDLAFLLMDLWHRDLKAHANLCFGTYVSKAMPTEVLNGLAALPIFLSARAAIRAVVAIDKLAITDKAAWDKVIAEINQYIELAESFLRPASPVLIAIGGLSGTGKTTVSAALAPHIGRAPGALHMRSDVERKRLAGIAPLRRLPTQAYSVSASDKVYKHLCDRAATALKAGHAVIVDAVFLDPHHRRMIEQVAAGVGVPFYGIWLEAPQDTLIERVAGRMHDASDADVDVVMGQLSQRSAVTCWESVDAGGQRSIVVARVKEVLPITSCADGVANSV